MSQVNNKTKVKNKMHAISLIKDVGTFLQFTTINTTLINRL